MTTKLADLFVVGKEHTITDPNGRTVTVWLQKLNTAESDEAFRRAQAARAVVLSAQYDHDSSYYGAALMDVFTLGDTKEALVEFLIGPERAQLAITRDAEMAADEEWSKDNYLQGLRDAWENGLSAEFARDPEHEDAARVFGELKRFADAVDAVVEDEVANLRAGYDNMTVDQLRDEAVKANLDAKSNVAWLTEYDRCEVWLGTRDMADHTEKYFSSRAEVDALQPETLIDLRVATRSLRIEVVEGKGLPEVLSSSPQSEQPDAEATAPSSGLVAVGP